jgi:AcrR family transcriptional regulator
MADVDVGSRDRLVRGAADMISRRGLNATSVRELAKHAKAPLGSTYHYFPGGKQQVATEAVQFAGEWTSRALAAALCAGPVAGLRAFIKLWRDVVVRSDFRAGCPVLAVSVEEPHEDETAPLEAAAKVFDDWESLLASSLREHGASRKDAEQVATLIVASIEGTVAMCRAARSIEPLDRVAAQLERAVQSATGAAR